MSVLISKSRVSPDGHSKDGCRLAYPFPNVSGSFNHRSSNLPSASSCRDLFKEKYSLFRSLIGEGTKDDLLPSLVPRITRVSAPVGIFGMNVFWLKPDTQSGSPLAEGVKGEAARSAGGVADP